MRPASTSIPEYEDPVLRGDDIILRPADVPVEEMTVEVQLALALKASEVTTLEERVVQVASFIYDTAPGDQPIFLFSSFLLYKSPAIILTFVLSQCLQGVYFWVDERERRNSWGSNGVFSPGPENDGC